MLSDFEFGLICIELAKHNLPSEIVVGIVSPIREEARFCRHFDKVMSKAFNGTSKSAKKRRAAQIGHCWKCGKLFHLGICPKNQTDSNFEMLELINFGTNKHLAENLKHMRKHSNVKQHASDLFYRANDIRARIISNARNLSSGSE